MAQHFARAIQELYGLGVIDYYFHIPRGETEPVMSNWPEGQPSRGSEPGDIPPWADAEPIIAARAAEVAADEMRDAVNAERDRRLLAGASFAVPGIADPIPLTGRSEDRTVYLALLLQAQGAKAQGITDPVHLLRDGSNTIRDLTPDQMIALITQAMQWFEAIMKVGWNMKDGTAPFEAGIPADYTDDSHWP